ncbi:MULTISPECIES: glycoside hydrolase family 105 protein [unclassified Paenibacillus]|uniref:beta-galactosidase BglB n=1 Tax=unclassified Paenibacillus TaxID=185978 RepID=UPI0009304268|nr:MULTISPECIES: glycoside hydrolase family 88 protein [unclassified Paenibacillus]
MTASIVQRTELEAVIGKIIEGMIGLEAESEGKINIISMNHWDWSQGVGLFSLYLYYKDSGDQDILDYLIQWFDNRIEEGLPSKNINTMCPMLTLSYLYEETGRQDYLELCQEWVNYAVNGGIPRTPEMGMAHATISGPNKDQLWDDTLYMTVLFVGRMGRILNNENYCQESIRQFLVHLKYLTDTSTGLFFHGWSFEGNHNYARVLWGRGNAWYTAGLVDYLDMVPLPQGVSDFLISSLERQVQTLEKLQAADGMWHTVLDDPASYVETSATSGFAYGILKAVRQGYLDAKYKETGIKALQAVLSRIDADGTVQGVSYGTVVGKTAEYYKQIKICPMPYGQSMALLMMVESLKHV